MAAPWFSQLCSPGSSWLCSEHWLMFWVNWSCLSLQSCTFMLTAVFTWVFMTVFRTLIDVLKLQGCTFMLTAVFTWVFMTVFRKLWLMFWGNWSGLSLQSCTLVFMAGCVARALPGCWQLFCSQGWAGCSPLLTDCTLCVYHCCHRLVFESIPEISVADTGITPVHHH